jgi:hypothetical protein
VAPSTGGVDPDPIGDIPLLLAQTTKAVDRAPVRTIVGRIRLGRWQLHRVAPPPEEFPGRAGYLIKVNYDFDLEPQAPMPTWVEIGFTLPLLDAVVCDALPRRVTRPEGARVYEITPHLGFAPARGARSGVWPEGAVANNIAMPPVVPRIDCVEIGDNAIRWRHTATRSDPIRAGSHSAWMVLVVPSRHRWLPVVATGAHDIDAPTPRTEQPVAYRDAFLVGLPGDAAVGPTDGSSTTLRGARHRGDPRVFVSYAHDSHAHKRSVARFCELLGAAGIDVRYDQIGLDTRRNWTDWTNAQIQRADYVIVIASPVYRAAGDGTLTMDHHRGVQSEFVRLADELHRDRELWTRKILPVVLPGRSPDEVPLAFLPHTADHYIIEDFTSEGAASLLSVLLRGASGTAR